jgi:ribosomal protein S18 acetylase RimI-like enzyme
MNVVLEELKNVKDQNFKKLFLSYFDELGVKLPDGYDVFSDIELSAKNEQMITIVAKQHSEMIGFIMFQPEQLISSTKFFKQDTTFIREFSVLKDYRKTGIGTQLMEYVFDYCNKNNIHTIILTTHSAQEYYLRLGFVEDSSYSAKNKQIVYIKKI